MNEVIEAARQITAKHRIFCDLILSGMTPHKAYTQAISNKTNENSNRVKASKTLALPHVQTYMTAVQAAAVQRSVLTYEDLVSKAIKLADGGDKISPATQLEAIQYLDACLSRNRTLRIEGLNLDMTVDESHVAAMAWAALKAEASGDLGTDDARHLIESAAMVQQIMHGRTVADGIERSPPLAMPQLPAPRVANGSNGNGSHSVTMTMPEPMPVRPRWLKTPEQIAEAALARKKGKTQ